MGIASATGLAAATAAQTDAGVGGIGSVEQRGFMTTLTIISRLEAVTLSMIDEIESPNRGPEWEIDQLRSPFININAGFQVADNSNTGPATFTPTQRNELRNFSTVWIRQISTEGTIRREPTNTADEHEFQVEQKEAIAMGRDINSQLLWSAGTAGSTSNGLRVAGGFPAFSGNVWLGGGAPVGGTSAVWNFQTVAYTQTGLGTGITAVTGTTVGAAQTNNTVINRLNAQPGQAGYLGAQVPVMTTAAVAGTGYVTNAYSRKVLNGILNQQFDVGGKPTNLVASPGNRSVFTELTSRQGTNDIYRATMADNREIVNTTTYYETDFGIRLRIDTEQQLRNYATATGGSPGTVPTIGNCPDNTRMILFNADNIKMAVVTPMYRNDSIAQPTYGATSALICEATFVFFNPNDIVSVYNLNPDVTSSQYT
ncbi:MAG: DUF5309 family protein [Cyclobacteriaceae bacterium]|nr:DUF5309 family protein [Cyclobacteriaceae bacterium]